MNSWVHNEANDEETEKNAHFNVVDDEMPDSVKQWIARLYLLYDVPLHYLVSDESMLQMESIRFFILDEQWLKTLAFGAMSVGRNTKKDVAVDRAAAGTLHKGAVRQLKYHRYSKMHQNHLRLHGIEHNYVSENDTQRSGFLLRSSIVSAWKGIEVKGLSNGKEIDILRMEAVSDNILFCLFDGILDELYFLEPAEVLHFGTRDDRRQIMVRKLESASGELNGDTVSIPTTPNGRVEMSKLVALLESSLHLQKGELTSAHLAYEMISTADICKFEKQN